MSSKYRHMHVVRLSHKVLIARGEVAYVWCTFKLLCVYMDKAKQMLDVARKFVNCLEIDSVIFLFYSYHVYVISVLGKCTLYCD